MSIPVGHEVVGGVAVRARTTAQDFIGTIRHKGLDCINVRLQFSRQGSTNDTSDEEIVNDANATGEEGEG